MTGDPGVGPDGNPGGSFAVRGGPPQVELARFLRYRGDHVGRVQFAFRLGPVTSVLDYGCGPGMAAFLLPASVHRYVGVELDPAPLQWARAHAPGPPGRTLFLTPDEFRSAPSGAPFDLVLLLEVIEHVSEPRALMERLIRELRPGGRLVVSTPNGALSRHDPRLFQSSFHLTEFDPVEFRSLVEGLGREVRLFEQHRRDRADPLPQLVARFLGSSHRPGEAPASAAGAKAPGRLFRLWESLPQPAAVWKVRPYPAPNRTDQGFSHQIAVITA